MALKVVGGGPNAGRFAEAGVTVMAAGTKAPTSGVIRNTTTGHARRVRAGALIPAGWTLDTPGTQSRRGPSEDTQSDGPSERWSRDELNDLAGMIGVEGADKLTNKPAVLAAIQAKATEDPEVVAAASGTIMGRRTERRQS